jgi:hypothetical protein
MAGLLRRVASQRLGGDRPSPIRAGLAAAAAGAAAAALTYRLLRSESG